MPGFLCRKFRSALSLAAGVIICAGSVFRAVGAQEEPSRPANPDWIIPHPALDLGQQWNDLGQVPVRADHPWLQDFWFLGRYNGQYYWSEGSNGSDEAYETRRFRLGFQARLVERLTLHAQAISGIDFEPVYNGFTELWAAWQFDPGLILTIGQQKHRFTHDRNASSRYINYLERSMLTNMFRADYTPAVNLSGAVGRTTYYAGVFSNATGQDVVDAFSELDSGYSLIGGIYFNLGDFLGMDQAFSTLPPWRARQTRTPRI